MLFSGALNFGIDRVVYRRLRMAPRLAPLIAAIGVSFILQGVGIYWKGSNSCRHGADPVDIRAYNMLNEWFDLERRFACARST